MGFFFTKLFRNVILLAVLFNGIQYYLKWKSYNVQVKDFKNVASKAAGGKYFNLLRIIEIFSFKELMRFLRYLE